MLQFLEFSSSKSDIRDSVKQQKKKKKENRTSNCKETQDYTVSFYEIVAV